MNTSRKVTILLEMDDGHLVGDGKASIVRYGTVQNGSHQDLFMEIDAYDGVRNYIWLDEAMLDAQLRFILDYLGDNAFS